MFDSSERSHEIANFGGNIRFRPAHYYEPRTEAEVLDILRRHAHGRVKVAAALHSWSELVVSEDAVVSLRHWTSVEYATDETGATLATVGAGCRIKDLLQELQRRGLTLPAIGLITEQMIAGAIATGTHGSGNHSLGHYVLHVRLAAYDADTGEPRIFDIDAGDDLRAARCHLGCMGLVLAVTFRCRAEYHVGERNASYRTLGEVLEHEPEAPLQHFFLVPHRWSFLAQHRAPAEPLAAGLYRFDCWLYLQGWFLTMDVGLHLMFKTLVCGLRSRRLTRGLFRHVLPYLVLKDKTYIARSDRILTWRHELFRHFEMEVFVPQEHLAAALEFLPEVLKVCDGAARAPAPAQAALLESVGLLERLQRLHGVFTHHYPICVRRILRDDTLISMASGDDESWYSISLITLQEPRDSFRSAADFIAESMSRLFRARLHWGKYFPFDVEHTAAAYPRLSQFAEICRRYDPQGVFQNEFTRRVLPHPRQSETNAPTVTVGSDVGG